MSNTGSITAPNTVLYTSFIKITGVCENPAFCWACNYTFKTSYWLTTSLAIHSSAGRTLSWLELWSPPDPYKNTPRSKWEKKTPLKNCYHLNLEHLLLWCQFPSWVHVAGLCHSTRTFYRSVVKLSGLQDVWHARDHTTITPLFSTCRDLCYDATLLTHIEEFHTP